MHQASPIVPYVFFARVLAALVVNAAAPAALAENAPTPPAINWLASESVNLLDWGLYQAARAADEAAMNLREQEAFGAKWSGEERNKGQDFLKSKANDPLNPLHQLGYDYWAGSARYDIEKSLIEIVFAVDTEHGPMWLGDTRASEQMVTADACIELLQDARNMLFMDIGRPPLGKSKLNQLAALIAMQRWFSHEGYARPNQPTALYADLVKITFLTVELSKYKSVEHPKVTCSAPLAGGPITTAIAPGSLHNNR